MTMTAFVPRGDDWILDDLADLPEDGSRYEILEGSLLVSPIPALPHGRALTRLHRLLIRQAPERFAVGQNIGVLRHAVSQTCLVPDLMIVLDEALDRDASALQPAEVLIVVEVLSPKRHAIDLVTKRHYYATMGVPQYWIVDPVAARLIVLRAQKENAYREEIQVNAGERWETDSPFDIELDPAEFC
jgi:Uma2 family endonuclease